MVNSFLFLEILIIEPVEVVAPFEIIFELKRGRVRNWRDSHQNFNSALPKFCVPHIGDGHVRDSLNRYLRGQARAILDGNESENKLLRKGGGL
jgi:hypothetical protein